MAATATGGFVLVVGPSGAGKDTVMRLAQQALADDATFRFPARVVTRAADAHEANTPLSLAAFEAAEAAGDFALAWRAHGNAYALPKSSLDAARQGAVVICNISRASVAEARDRLPVLAVVEITASPDVLAQRIAARGRPGDQGAGLESRLARSSALPDVAADVRIVNDDAPALAAQALLRALRAL